MSPQENGIFCLYRPLGDCPIRLDAHAAFLYNLFVSMKLMYY
jgi:hypothetical protein